MPVGSPEIQLQPENREITGNLARRFQALRATVFPSNSPIRARLARGAFWSVFDTGFTRFFTLAVSIVVARAVGKLHFGEYGVVQSTIGMFGLFAGMGMSVTATKYVAELRHSNPARTGKILGLSTLLAMISSTVATLILIAIVPWLARTTLASAQLGTLLRLGCGLLFFGVLNGALYGALYGFEGFREIAIVDVVANLLGSAVIIIGVLKAGIPGAIVGLVVSVGLQCIGYSFFLYREMRRNGIAMQYRGCLDEWPVLAKFSAPALLAAVMAGPVNWVCSAIVVNQPDGYAQMGLFNAANQWRGAVMLLPTTLGAPFLPILTSLYGKDPAKYFKVLRAGIAMNATLASLAAAGIIVFSRIIMGSYGASFVSGTPVLIFLVLSAVLAATVALVGQAISSSGEMWWGFILNFIWAVALISSLYGLRHRGAYGYAIATLIAYFVHLITSSAFVYKRVNRRSTPTAGDFSVIPQDSCNVVSN